MHVHRYRNAIGLFRGLLNVIALLRISHTHTLSRIYIHNMRIRLFIIHDLLSMYNNVLRTAQCSLSNFMRIWRSLIK